MFNFFKTLLIPCLLVASMGSAVQANHLRIQNLAYDQDLQTVNFQIRWNNSWRVTLEPSNWDAAWVFVKFRECGVDPNTEWDHGVIDYAGCTWPAELEAVDGDNNPGLYPDRLGAMLRRTNTGLFPDAGWHSVTLNIENLPAPGTELDVKAFGVEMVYIPTGPFWMGDNDNGSLQAKFHPPRYIDSEIQPDEFAFGSGCAAASFATLDDDFPKGYQSFYLMKYEITQGQYVDFLNTLGSSQAGNRYHNTTANRYTLNNTATPPNTYACTRPDRAMNWIDWADLTAYCDWAALRPMTEFEYEKACRGPNAPVAGEYAWGNSNGVPGTVINGTEDGTEIFLDNDPLPNFAAGNINYAGGDGGQGPVRAGIFALPTSTGREQSGAGYYGNMELTGNVYEMVVAATNDHTMDRSVGDGYLTADANHDVPSWPAHDGFQIDGTTTHSTWNCRRWYVTRRGGGYATGTTSVRHQVSDRGIVRDTSNPLTRRANTGGRAAR